MTLCVAGLNRRQVVVAGDRRLTVNGDLFREDATKLTLVETRDARGVISFSGLAQVEMFRTEEWLLETLLAVAAPQWTLGVVVHRLAERAAERVASLTINGRPLTADQRRLSFYFAGYCYPDGDVDDPRMAYCFVSNFERAGEQLTDGSAPGFEVTGAMEISKEKRTADPPACVVLGGNHRVVRTADAVSFRDLLEGDAPTEALVGKAVDVVRETGRRPAAEGTIGDDVLTAIIPSDAGQEAVLSHHSPGAAAYLTSANIAHLGGDDDAWLARDVRIEVEGGKIAPKLDRNDRCWCSSGLKFKRCHGR